MPCPTCWHSQGTWPTASPSVAGAGALLVTLGADGRVGCWGSWSASPLPQQVVALTWQAQPCPPNWVLGNNMCALPDQATRQGGCVPSPPQSVGALAVALQRDIHCHCRDHNTSRSRTGAHRHLCWECPQSLTPNLIRGRLIRLKQWSNKNFRFINPVSGRIGIFVAFMRKANSDRRQDR